MHFCISSLKLEEHVEMTEEILHLQTLNTDCSSKAPAQFLYCEDKGITHYKVFVSNVDTINQFGK